jgi:carbamoyltransferase
MRILGINCMNHDAAMAVVDYSSGIGEILWAAHAERYSKVKNDHYLNQMIVDEANTFGPFDKVVYYEKPLLKKTRQFYAGQYGLAMSYTEMPQWHLDHFGIKIDEYVKHHDSHAAAGYFTSPFNDEGATILTVDAIGEWETVSISTAHKNHIERKETIRYPHSIGILYSAFTHRCGLKPAEEEYILMGMAAYGTPKYKDEIYRDFISASSEFSNDDGDTIPAFRLKQNLHRGLRDWHPEADVMDLAASIQQVTEEVLANLWYRASKYGSRNLVYAGGVALNCAANRVLANMELFDNIWIIPNPGDAGSSIGCIAAHEKKFIKWENPFLGHNIDGEYPVDSLIKELKENKMVGVASGRAEFGPRALGNRSLLADPRGEDIKDLVNTIKKRQKFRPFAPAILEEDVNEYFYLPKGVKNTPYMQFTAPCTHGKTFPAIIHHDSTSRVQTVRKTDNPGFHALLTEWKKQTGCPILLNTSLNIKGQPIVNDRADGKAFTNKYGVKVLG